jgi:hypothetical protein
MLIIMLYRLNQVAACEEHILDILAAWGQADA